jgi:hypothetical protein
VLRSVLFFFLCGVASVASADEPLPEPELIRITRASVSNWQVDPNTPARWAQFHYRFAFDGKLDTSWGTGGNFFTRKVDWIILYLERPMFVTYIRVAPGLQGRINPANPGNAFLNYIGNGRPADVTLKFSDQSKQRIYIDDFEDESQMGFVNKPLWPVYTSWVWLQVDSIHAGDTSDTRTQDFGIAEIEIYGYDTLPTRE